jgi:hypothetical protein
MKITFISIFIVTIIFLCGSIASVNAQDTIKKTTVAKKPLPIDPATGKPAIPINPKTGRPYSKYGYGSYAKTYKEATAADSLKKAAALKSPAQKATTPPVDSPVVTAPVDKSLNGQYQYLLTKVYNYQQPLVAALWKNVIDTLNSSRRKLVDEQTKAAAQDKVISDLKADATTKDESVSKADEISLMGISLSKNIYSLIMWALVIIFAAIAGIVIVRSGSLKQEATHRTSLYTNLEEEFKAYKSKANEKEKKLARELQTERNKLDELMGRG